MACLVLSCAVVFFPGSARAEFQVSARHAILMDVASGTILFAKEPDAVIAPGNLSKMLGLSVVFDDVEAGRVALDTPLRISEYAWRIGGAPSRTSTMFAPLNGQFTVQDLITGVAVVAANDGILALAQGVSETEEVFAARMNEKAAGIGMARSRFVNATGFPATSQQTTPHDMVKLSQYFLTHHAKYMPYFSVEDIFWSNIRQRNRNPLFYAGLGVDGFMANYVADVGHGGLFTAVRDGRRLLVMVSGLATTEALVNQVKTMIDWGFDGFTHQQIFKQGDIVGQAKIFGGNSGQVPLMVQSGDIKVFVPKRQKSRVQVRIVYKGPLRAPVEKGMHVGQLQVWRDDILQREVPVLAAEDVPQGTLIQRALDGVWAIGSKSFSAVWQKLWPANAS